MNKGMLKALGLVLYALIFLSLGVYLHSTLVETPRPEKLPPFERAVISDRSTPVVENAFVSVAAKVTPAVVNISTIDRGKALSDYFHPFRNDPPFRGFFDRFFGDFPRRHRQMSLGSGVIIDKAGYILTNNHVIRDADEIAVKLADKREYRGRVIGTDPKTDLAVIKVDAKEEFPTAILGDSDALQVGEWALAIGNPFGLDHTVTVGVVSATGRSDVGIATYENFIQTDASINPGNSGGPLLNVRGEVIGINTAIIASGQGIGFAIPIGMAKKVISDLMKRGKVIRGWLGVGIQSLTPELAGSLGFSLEEGVFINRVMPNSPAEAAGLKEGDVIISIDSQRIKDSRQLQRMVAELEVGRAVKVGIIRDRKPFSLNLKVGELPS